MIPVGGALRTKPVPLTPPESPANQQEFQITQTERRKTMKKLIIVTALAALMSGCYIGKAAFQMRLSA